MRALATNLAVAESMPPRIAAAPRTHQPAAARFDELMRVAAGPDARVRARPLGVSTLVHGVLVAAAMLLPLLWDSPLPALPDDALRAFFVVPEVAPPPPPPPAPPRARPSAAAPRTEVRPAAVRQFVAPIEVPDVIKPSADIDLGIDGGVEGGVEGGVPGGVAGGVVGGILPAAPPPPPAAVVRIGGAIKAPKLLHVVPPEYPQLAAIAHVAGSVIVEADVDQDGRVVAARVLRGHPLLDESAEKAVRQWRYKPLLLNGVPTAFVLTVNVQFTLTTQPTGK